MLDKVVMTVAFAVVCMPAYTCEVKSYKWDQGRSGTAKIKVQGVSDCKEKWIKAIVSCDGELLSIEKGWVGGIGEFRLWPDGNCSGELSMEYIISDNY